MKIEMKRNDQRKFTGLIVNRHAQFKLAVVCSTLILLPSVIASITSIASLASATQAAAAAGTPSLELAENVAKMAFHSGLYILTVFIFFGGASVFLSLKLSNQIVGPITLLETQIRNMIDGNYSQRRALRKGDYLEPLGKLLNELAAELEKQQKERS